MRYFVNLINTSKEIPFISYIVILYITYMRVNLDLVMNRQIAQLDQMLQRTSNTPENRYSLSGENANKYNVEVSDHIQKCEYLQIMQITELIFPTFV